MEPAQDGIQGETTTRKAQYENEQPIENEIETNTRNEIVIETETETETKHEIETKTETCNEVKNETETKTATENQKGRQPHATAQSQRPIQTTTRTRNETGLSCQFHNYSLQSKVLFSGIGADELCGGYVRYQSAFTNGGREASWEEMTKDWSRLWIRNLVVSGKLPNSQGRDDRCISEFGREMRTPFLDEDVSVYLRNACFDCVME